MRVCFIFARFKFMFESRFETRESLMWRFIRWSPSERQRVIQSVAKTCKTVINRATHRRRRLSWIKRTGRWHFIFDLLKYKKFQKFFNSYFYFIFIAFLPSFDVPPLFEHFMIFLQRNAYNNKNLSPPQSRKKRNEMYYRSRYGYAATRM